ncbi:MAG: ubiquinol-cytochrome c reductase iron-sulfur subunit [Chitinophagales bacterium]
MKRKDFIRTCGLACLSGSILAATLESCQRSVYFAQSSFANNIITINKTEFISIINNKTVTRKFILVKTEQFIFPICIYKLNETEYSALLMECTHKGCELQPQGNYLVCPCHGSEFTNKGYVQNPPAEQNLKSFKTTTDNEYLYIQL